MKKILCILICSVIATGCAGMRSNGGTFSTHAESFRFFGHAIPRDDQAAAMKLVPKDAKIDFIHSTPADWDSFWGFLGNIFWLSSTHVSGTVPNK